MIIRYLSILISSKVSVVSYTNMLGSCYVFNLWGALSHHSKKVLGSIQVEPFRKQRLGVQKHATELH